MLRLKGDGQLTFWDTLLPPEVTALNEELSKVDRLLDDEQLLMPFIERFNTRMGRPTVPVETYLRMMYLKFRYQLGYESLVQEVSDSIQWRRFCRIPLHESVPHSTTLIKLTKRYGPDSLKELNELLIKRARDKKLIRGQKLRVDTTVVEADIRHPTDSGLLADATRVITRIVKQIKASGIAIRTRFRNRTRSIKKRILSISKVLRRRAGNAYQEVRAITGEIMAITQATVADAKRIIRNAKHYAWRKGCAKARRMAAKLERAVALTERLIQQTQAVQEGSRSIPNRLVSLFDTGARPIRKGKVSRPTEFGRKVLLQETEEHIITGYEVYEGNPSDESLLPTALKRHQETFGQAPRAIATDRGFGSAKNERLLQEAGVKRISLPRKGRLSAKRREYERQPWFKRLQRWRAGAEATIGLLKRKYGLRRSLFKGTEGTQAWVGFAIMAYNLKRLATLS